MSQKFEEVPPPPPPPTSMSQVPQPPLNPPENQGSDKEVLESLVPNPEGDSKDAEASSGNRDEQEEEEEGVECGFLVDRINNMPYQKALERGEVPFCAFAPISKIEDLYLLRIQDCPDTARHMLVPASKDEVFSIPGALKIMDSEQEPGNESTLNYRVAIVAIARQIYSEEDKQLVVSVDTLLKKDKKKISSVKFLTVDKFADFAFLGFDGNISEFATKSENDPKDTRSHREQQSTRNNNVASPSLVTKVKPVPKAPVRRGRGGRRRVSRRSPQVPPPSGSIFQVPPPSLSSSQMFPGSFQPLPHGSYHPHPGAMHNTYAFVKVDEHGQPQQYLTQLPVTQFQDMNFQAYNPDAFHVPIQLPPMMQPELQVPMPVNEVIVSTSEPGAKSETQQTNHDILTIAFDQLVSMTNDFNVNPCAETTHPERGMSSSRGGRRPGRKPGRKPANKEKHPDYDESTTFGQLLNFNAEPAGLCGPKRRGRPPKNRLMIPIISSGVENEAPTAVPVENGAADVENNEKRVKLFE